MTKSWIERLGEATLSESGFQNQDSMLDDHRITYLSDFIQKMMIDHEIDYHDTLENFNPDIYLDSQKGNETTFQDRYTEAINMLNAMEKVEYGFYEIFKPIGKTGDRHLTIRMSTSGEIDISGVIDIEDCEHIEWKYGSPEYLRALNTGNQMYDFRLSIPLNDENSVLWWKPDHDEPMDDVADEESEDDNEDITVEEAKYRYYKPYETERYLRWFGTSFVPRIDESTISRKTICSSPAS